MTPLERLSAVRSEVKQRDKLLLSLLDLEPSTSSVPPTTAKDKPADTDTRGLSVCVSLVTNSASSCSRVIVFVLTCSCSTDELCVLAAPVAQCLCSVRQRRSLWSAWLIGGGVLTPESMLPPLAKANVGRTPGQ